MLNLTKEFFVYKNLENKIKSQTKPKNWKVLELVQSF